jgi:predicted TIM-barrel fold metal-dependent hydrolase
MEILMTGRIENRCAPRVPSELSNGHVAGGVSRRALLKQLVAIGAGAALSTGSVLAAVPPVDSSSRRGRIDVHHHMLPPFYMELRRRVANIGEMPTWSPAKSLEDMDKNGVTLAMLSLAVSGVTFEVGEAGRNLARKSNDFGAQLVADHPMRFGLLASLPLPDAQGSLMEIGYALDTLHANGIALLSSYGDKWLGDPTYVPIFEELDRHKTVVFVHPTAPQCCANLVPHVPASTMEFLFDTTRTINSLLINGTFSRFPNIRFIFAHGGGTLPMLAYRMARIFPKNLASLAPQGVLYELRRQYYDTASASNPSSLAALTNLVPSSQIVFGSDFPFLSAQETASDLMHSGLPAKSLEAINSENAARLFDRVRV